MSKYSTLFNEVKAAAVAPSSMRIQPQAGFTMSEEQLTALNSPFKESALIYAGAGAGKTRLLIERVAALLNAGACPKKLAVVTFTRKAAEEIKSRLSSRFGPSQELPICGTVHSLALRGLRKAEIPVNIADDELVLSLFEQFRINSVPSEYEDLSNGELLMLVNRIRESEGVFGVEGYMASEFEQLLTSNDLMDFTAILKSALSTVKPHLDYVLVDEVQDLSSLQRSFLMKAANLDARFWYIGDSDQSIYSFRGSHSRIMDELATLADKTHILSANYRSASSIVKHSLNVICNNSGRKDIEWKANRKDTGNVCVKSFDTSDEELAAATSWLQSATEGESRAVLSRTQFLITTLREQGLPAFSVHESKGLEWNQVWVMGCESSLFPHPLGAEDEERRLFYVAMTRARDSLILSNSAQRRVIRKGESVLVSRSPSFFLQEAGVFN